jgi:hypothetical protein
MNRTASHSSLKRIVTLVFRYSLLAACIVLTLSAAGDVQAQADPTFDDGAPVHIPLTVWQTPSRTYKAAITVGIGSDKTLPFGFDTGSTGLRVFADADLGAPQSGVQCSQTPTSVTYGNPARIIYSGVVCYAQLHFGTFTTPTTIPFAYLTSASCPSTNPHCNIPDLHSRKAMGSYGVFGAGITGSIGRDGSVPNPILTLPGRLGSTYSILLTHTGGELVLGGTSPPGAERFKLTPGKLVGQKWELGQACLFVDGRATNTCLTISFDTGNGVPWLHSVSNDSVPQANGIVIPSTRVGFAPVGDSEAAISFVAGGSFSDKIKVVEIPGKPPIANVSIQVFLNRTVTYDNTIGEITFSVAQ